ncbi:MAG: sigma-54-dependent Fis family transcriptional regulator, partial [Deltaproteobacteria bacterium]|nr:sigma-54-dependent Fis family transcriptional regulator [Deltaproteobacteria bacterium]
SFSDSLPLDHLHQMLDELTKAQKPASASFAQTIRTADVAQDIPPANRQKALQADCRWMLYAPLSTEQKLLGHLVLHYSDRPTLTRPEKKLLKIFCFHLGLFLSGTLFTHTHKQRRPDHTAAAQPEQLPGNSIPIIHNNHQIKLLLTAIDQIAARDVTVLITGETGTGKDLIAQEIHRRSPRRGNPFYRINCAALVPTLIESEIFGHEKGAFTGATMQKIGRFEMAHNSTLLLDEISELPLQTQAKLLQVLQEHTFERVGGTKTITSNARIIAATNQNLYALVHNNQFRSDLFFRLNIFPLDIPPLRERKDDIPALVLHFTKAYGNQLNLAPVELSKSAIQTLQQYHWPGNVRELQSFIARLTITESGKHVSPETIDSLLALEPHEPTLDYTATSLDLSQKQHIEEALRKTHGVVGGMQGAAKMLGVKKSKLFYQIKRLQINTSAFRQFT